MLHLLAQGLTNRGIRDQLVLSPKTVASHVRHIFAKLAIPGSDHDNRRVRAVLVYLNDITAPPPSRKQRPAKTTDTNGARAHLAHRVAPCGQLTAGNAAPQYECRGNGEPVLVHSAQSHHRRDGVA